MNEYAKILVVRADKNTLETSARPNMFAVNSDNDYLAHSPDGVNVIYYPTSAGVNSQIDGKLPNQNLNTSASVTFASISSPTITNLQNAISTIASTSLSAVVKNPTDVQTISGGIVITNTLIPLTIGTSGTGLEIYNDGEMVWSNGGNLYSPSANFLATDGSLSAVNLSATTINVGNVSNTEFQYLDGVSANIQTQLTNLSATKTDKTTTITAGTGLTGGGNLTTNRTIALATTGTAGTYTKVTTDAYGRVTAGTQQTSADIPQLPATKIGSGNIDNTEFEYLDAVSANIQTQLNGKQSTLTNPVTGTGASGQVAYWNGANTLTSTDGFLFDGTKLSVPALGAGVYAQFGFTSFAGNLDPAGFSLSGYTGNLIGWNRTGGGRRFDFVSNVSNTSWDHGFDWWSNANGAWTNLASLDKNGNFNLPSLTALRVVITDASKNLASSSVTSTELYYLNGASANIQTQLTNLSALDSQKALKTTTITAGTGLTGGGDLTTNRTISLATTGTSGTYTKVTTNSYGQVTAGTALTSGDIPQIPATKIGSGNINNTEFEYLNGLSANIQNQINSAISGTGNIRPGYVVSGADRSSVVTSTDTIKTAVEKIQKQLSSQKYTKTNGVGFGISSAASTLCSLESSGIALQINLKISLKTVLSDTIPVNWKVKKGTTTLLDINTYGTAVLDVIIDRDGTYHYVSGIVTHIPSGVPATVPLFSTVGLADGPGTYTVQVSYSGSMVQAYSSGYMLCPYDYYV